MNPIALLCGELARCGGGLAVESCDSPTEALEHAEQLHLSTMDCRRAHEFACGRLSARKASTHLGTPLGSLLPDADGVPNWPPSITGSISHKRGVAIAAVGPTQHWESIGVDLEFQEASDRDLQLEICREDEGPSLLVAARTFQSPLTVMAAAKEALYKCQFKLRRRELDWYELAIDFDGRGGFVGRAIPDGQVADFTAKGFVFQSGDWIVALCLVATKRA